MKIYKKLSILTCIMTIALIYSANAEMNMSVDYNTGDVTITGIAKPEDNVTVSVTSPSGRIVYIDQQKGKSSSIFTVKFNTETEYGSYTVKTNVDGNKSSDEIKSDVFVPEIYAEGVSSGKRIYNINDLSENDDLKLCLKLLHNSEKSSVSGADGKLLCGVYDEDGKLIYAAASEEFVSDENETNSIVRDAVIPGSKAKAAKLIKTFLWENGTMYPYTGTYSLTENPYKKSLKILTVGNSHAENSNAYLYELAKGAGIENVVVGYTFQNGSSISDHAKLLKSNGKYKYKKNTGEGLPVEYTLYSTRDAVKDEDWDIILIQEFSLWYGQRAAERQQDIDYIIGEIKKEATNPNVKIGWNACWAFSDKYTRLIAENNYGGDSLNWNSVFGSNSGIMYKTISDGVKNEIAVRDDISLIVFSNTAVQNARTSEALMKKDGNMLSWDAVHMDSNGDVLVGLGYLKALGIGIDDISLSCLENANDEAQQIKTLTDSDFEIMKKAVNAAYEKPYMVTDIN